MMHASGWETSAHSVVADDRCLRGVELLKERALTAPNSTPAATSTGIMLGSATRLVKKCGATPLRSLLAASADTPD